MKFKSELWMKATISKIAKNEGLEIEDISELGDLLK